MLEVYPDSGVFWYRGQKEATMYNIQNPKAMISRLIDVFFTKETQGFSSARGGGKYPLLNDTIVSACLRKLICLELKKSYYSTISCEI